MSKATSPTHVAEPVGMTQPLHLRRYLSTPRTGFDAVPFLDFLLIGLFFILAGSRYLFAPGISIELPTTAYDPIPGIPASVVLTVQESELIFFEGRKETMESLPRRLQHYVQTHGEVAPILLLRADRNVDLEDVLRICEMARIAGFGGVQVAAEPTRDGPPLFPRRDG